MVNERVVLVGELIIQLSQAQNGPTITVGTLQYNEAERIEKNCAMAGREWSGAYA